MPDVFQPIGRRFRETGPWFLVGVLGVAVAFFGLQLEYVHTLPLVMDEYVEAHHAYQLLDQVPYRDFQPYKTTLGYYAFSWILARSADHWSGLMAVKTLLALLNATMMVAGAIALRRHLSGGPILLALVLLACMSTYAERASELRVDMSTAWGGFISLLFLLRGRAGLSGLFAALSFLISQKGIYYVAAGEFALVTLWLMAGRTRKQLGACVRFNLVLVASLVAYFVVWSSLSSVEVVYRAVFARPASMKFVFENIYSYDLRFHYWERSILQNPVYYALAFLALWVLDRARRRRPTDEPLWIALAFCGVVLVCCFWHKQAWPYFMVMLFPFTFVLHAFLFDEHAQRAGPGAVGVLGLSPVILSLVLTLGMIYPLSRVEAVFRRDAGRQRNTVELAEWLLQPGETYLGGVPYLYKIDQAHPGFKSLDRAQQRRIKQSEPLAREMLEAMKNAPMKVVVQSYRLKGLPPSLKQYLDQHYEPLHANVDVYSPRLTTDRPKFSLKFTGRYRLRAKRGTTVEIDGKSVKAGQFVSLGSGEHRVGSTSSGTEFRLRFEPPGVTDHMDPRFAKPAALFPIMYDY